MNICFLPMFIRPSLSPQIPVAWDGLSSFDHLMNRCQTLRTSNMPLRKCPDEFLRFLSEHLSRYALKECSKTGYMTQDFCSLKFWWSSLLKLFEPLFLSCIMELPLHLRLFFHSYFSPANSDFPLLLLMRWTDGFSENYVWDCVHWFKYFSSVL